MKKADAVLAGEIRAKKESVATWGVLGFLIAIITVPAAHLRSPQAPATLLAEHEDEATVDYFAQGYSQALKQRQIMAAWAGFGVAFLVFMLALA